VLVIPAWNEPESIGRVLAEVPPGLFADVLVVVGSRDDPTADVAQASGARVLVQQARGYGAACWTGASAALADAADVVAFIDGDYSDPPAELARILAPIVAGRADLVLGCRDLRRHPNALPLHARLGNVAVRWAIQFFARGDFADVPSCKAIRADCLQLLNMREMTYGWTVELLVKSARLGLRTEQVWIAYRPRLGGRSKVAGTVRGSLGAATKLLSCAITYARWTPH
jgi:glycosyltransferase involved in cell wall biosynthesis